MPRRTVTVKHLYVHELRKPKSRKDVANFDGFGADLLVILRGFINGLDEGALIDAQRERYLSTINLHPDGRTLLVEMEVGYYGSRGRVKNVKTHVVEHEHDAGSAATTDVRFLAVAPPGSQAMLVFVESHGRSVAATHVLPLFHAAWRNKWEGDDLVLKIDTLVETDAWLQRAELEEVSGVVTGYDWGHDRADAGTPKTLGRLHTTLEPDGAHQYLPRFIWTGLRDRNLDAARVLGLPDGAEVEELKVKVAADGKTKTFALDRERQPALSYLLSQQGMPDDYAFKRFSFDLAKDLLPAVGGEWKTAFESGAWSEEQLQVTLERPNE